MPVMNATPDIIVIGGGAAGLMAAGSAAEAGARVLLIEKMNRPGRKLAITGKGRCNLTNVAPRDEFLTHFGDGAGFLHEAFSHFFAPDLVKFFEARGLPLVTERGGRVFPASGKAPDVVQALRTWTKDTGVRLSCSERVTGLTVREGRIEAVQTQTRTRPCAAAIITTGGASYPATGSTGDGYQLAHEAGHTVVPHRPALVPLETTGTLTRRAAGLCLRHIRLALLEDGERTADAFGEFSFTDFGITGPVVLTLSGRIVDVLRQRGTVALSLDLKPALSREKLDARLIRDLAARGDEPCASILRGLLPKPLVAICCQATGMPSRQPGNRVSAKQRAKLLAWLKDVRLEVSGHRPFKEAIITAGGVSTDEVTPTTMASTLVGGLFFAGEVLDIQADTGGYNLQAAFSTGHLAGQSAAATVNIPQE